MQIIINEQIVNLDLKKNLLHEGRFGLTFCTSLKNGKKIIIKQYKPKKNDHEFERKRFKRQAEIAKQLYPEINADSIEIEDQLFYYHEFIEGNTLSFPLKKEIRKNKEETLVLVLKEIQRLHQLNYIHTDIKPSNFIVRNKEVFILDFGSCIQVGEKVPRDYIIPFTMIYAPPEMIVNHYEICNFSSDLYMWGLLAFQILSKMLPFSHCNPVMLMHQQLNSKLPYHYVKDKKWQNVIQKATEKVIFPKPPHFYKKEQIDAILLKGIEKRYQTADELLKELSE
jgi:serine/threonine protein kinase